MSRLSSTVKRPLAVVCASLLLWIPSFSQDNFDEIHREDFSRWSQVTTLSPPDIHRMWRSTSHYANESDDDLSSNCSISTLLVLGSKSWWSSVQGFRDVSLSLSSLPLVDIKSCGKRIRDPITMASATTSAIPVAVNVTKDGKIEVTTAVYPDDKEASRAVTRPYSYRWDGNSYAWSATRDSSSAIRAQKK
jgi:hypothetical protein